MSNSFTNKQTQFRSLESMSFLQRLGIPPPKDTRKRCPSFESDEAPGDLAPKKQKVEVKNEDGDMTESDGERGDNSESGATNNVDSETSFAESVSTSHSSPSI